MSRIIAIVQARMSSTRLPGKVLKILSGRPVIEQVFNQLSFSEKINDIVLATSIDKIDDELEKWAKDNDKSCFRGDLENVLKRFYEASIKFNADVIVRITADCPLIDPEVVDKVIDEYTFGKYDYCSNTNPPTFPDGLDAEVFSFKSLEAAYNKANLQSEIEHVTPYIRNHPEIFKLGNLSSKQNYEHYRWTLDNPEDYKFLSIVYEKLYIRNSYIKFVDVLNLLNDNKELLNINSNIIRNEGYIKSLNEDKKIK